MVSRNRPRILVVLKGLAVGGAEKLVLEQTRFWDREAFDYHISYLESSRDELADAFRALGVPVHAPRNGGALHPGVLLGVYGEIRELRPDLIHAHLPYTGVLIRLLPGIGTPIVYTEHNMPRSYHPVTRLVNRLTYRRNDAVICVSDAVQDSVQRYRCRRLLTVANAVGLPRVNQPPDKVRQELGLKPEDKLIVHVGNIREGKGHATLIETVSCLSQLRDDVVVVSAGSEQIPGELARLRETTHTLGHSDRLRFIGLRHDVPDLMHAADVIINPSDVEGLPIVLLEAMQLRKPIVATDVGGVGSLIIDEVTGLLVSPGSPDLLANGIHRLLSNPGLAKRVGEAGKDRVAEGFSVEAAVRKTEDLYRSVLLNNRGNKVQ